MEVEREWWEEVVAGSALRILCECDKSTEKTGRRNERKGQKRDFEGDEVGKIGGRDADTKIGFRFWIWDESGELDSGG